MEKDTIAYKLPKGWIWTTIGEIGIVTSGGTPSTNNPRFWGNEIAWITPADLSDYHDIYISKGSRGITKLGLDYSSAKLLPKGSILFSSRAPIGYVAIAQNEIATNQGFKNLIISKYLRAEYIYYYFRTIKPIAEKIASGTTFLELSATKFSQIPVPLSPLNEQNRIVEKIETLFSELDYAEVALKKAQKQLESYRLSLLKCAFNGELTKTWRESNKTVSAIDALKIIKEERKRKYESSLKNKTFKKAEKDFEFEFSQNDKIDTWANATLNNLIDINARIGWRGLKKDEYIKNGPLFLSVYSLNYGKNIVFDDANHITIERYEESPEIQLKENDILLCKDGAGIGKIGIIKHLPDKATVNSSLLVIKAKEIFVPDFLYYLLSGPMMQELVKEKISGSAIPHLFQKEIKKFNLKVPPIDEQMQIVNQLESSFALTDNLNNSITNGLKRTSVLRHTILSKAFKGEIVSQNSNDDSAKNLLKQIRKEKELYLVDMKEKIKLKPAKTKIMENKKAVLDILLEAKEPISAKELWQQSKHKENIEEFYSELKDIQNKIIEIKKDTESFLALKR